MEMPTGAVGLIAAYASEAQGRRLLRMDFPHGDAPGSVMLANTLDADEAVSRDFHIDVEVLSDDALIPLKAVMGKMVTISLVRDDGALRYFNGYVFAFRFVKTDGGFAFYRMELGPWLGFLRLRHDCRTYQNLSLTELCDAAFADYLQRDHQYHMTQDAPELTLAIQYNESDHNHLHRRLESAGMLYWYEHRADGHTLHISDDSSHCSAIDGGADIAYQNEAGSAEGDGIHRWEPARQAGPGKLTVNSHNFKNARAARSERSSLNRQGAIAAYEVYEDTGSYGFKNDDDGEAMATRRMEAIDAGGQDFSAGGNCRTERTRALSARRFRYDPAGNLLAIEQDGSANVEGVFRYAYDPVGQLLSAVQPGLTETFAFDPAGNLLETASPAQARRGNGDDAGLAAVTHNLLQSYHERHYRYDEQGNVVSKHVAPANGAAYELKLGYDADNRLVHAIKTTSMQRITARYFYDAFSRRIAKRVAKEELGRRDSPPPGDVTSLFVWDGDLMVQELGGDKTVTYVYEPESFVPLARIASARGGDGDGIALPLVPQWQSPGWREKGATDSPGVEHGKNARPLVDADIEPGDDRIEYFHCDISAHRGSCSTARATSSGVAGSGHGAGRSTKSEQKHQQGSMNSRSGFRRSIGIRKRGCITTGIVTMMRKWGGSFRRIRLGCWGELMRMLMRKIRLFGSIR